MSTELNVLERPRPVSHPTMSKPPAPLPMRTMEHFEIAADLDVTRSHWASSLDFASVAGASSIVLFKLFLLGLLVLAI